MERQGTAGGAGRSRGVRGAAGLLACLLAAGVLAGLLALRERAREERRAVQAWRSGVASLTGLDEALAALRRLRVEARLDAASLQLPGLGAELEKASVSLQLGAGSFEPSGRVEVAALRDASRPVRFVPVHVAASFRTQGDALQFEARADAAAGRARLEASGRHDLARGAGHADLRVPALHFGPGQLSPAELVPGLAGGVRSVRGLAEALGRVEWSPGALTSRTQVALRGVDLVTDLVRVEGIHAVVELHGPRPLSTPAGQLVSMGRLDFGLALSEGLVRFRLHPEGILELEAADWSFAGGRVHAAGRLDPSAPEQSMTLRVEALDLAQLLALVRLEGLSGEGRIGGSLPLHLRGDTLEIRAGHLEASGPGRLRYASSESVSGLASGTPGLDVLVGALRNLRYEKLSLDIDGTPTGQVDLGLHLAGANPDYRNGQPIELNLELQAELGDLLRERELSTWVPREVQRHLERFGRGTRR